jgi:serine O-acetyltransferase
MVGSGAKILGPFRVGDNAKIAANAVVLEEIPNDCTAVGVPARIVKRNGQKISVSSDLDQIHIPDPISQEICRLYARIDELHNEITKLKEDKQTNENL